MNILRNIVFLFAIFFVNSNVDCWSNDSLFLARKYHTTVYLKLSSAYNTSSSEFFDIYGKVLGGVVNQFKISPEIGLAVKLQISPYLRLGLSVDYTESKISDSYFQEFKDFESKGLRFIGQDITFRQLPILLNLEYIPYWGTQFRTFAGVGAGVNPSLTLWNERISSNVIYDKRESGDKFNSVDFLGAYRIYAGVDLGFDRQTLDHYLASFILQLSYTEFLGNIDFFEKIRSEFESVPNELFSKVLPVPGYLSLGICISFNFNRRK